MKLSKQVRILEFAKSLEKSFKNRVKAVYCFGSLFHPETSRKFLCNDYDVIIILSAGDYRKDVPKIRRSASILKTKNIQLQLIYERELKKISKFYSFHTGLGYLFYEIRREAKLLVGEGFFDQLREPTRGLVKVDSLRKNQQYLDQLVSLFATGNFNKKNAYLYLKRFLMLLKDFLYYKKGSAFSSCEDNFNEVMKIEPSLFSKKEIRFVRRLIKAGPKLISEEVPTDKLFKDILSLFLKIRKTLLNSLQEDR